MLSRRDEQPLAPTRDVDLLWFACEADDEQADTRGKTESKQRTDHCPPPPTRNARDSLTGYDVERVRCARRQRPRPADRPGGAVGDVPDDERLDRVAVLAAAREHVRVMTLVARQTARLVDVLDRIAGEASASYGTPGPPSSAAPSPKRHSTVGSAITLTVSPASEIDNDCRRGAGSSQNHDGAPVKPARAGLVLISPGASSTRRVSDCATADGDSRPAPLFVPGPTRVKHGVTLFGTYWHACPAASVYQKLPGPHGCWSTQDRRARRERRERRRQVRARVSSPDRHNDSLRGSSRGAASVARPRLLEPRTPECGIQPRA